MKNKIKKYLTGPLFFLCALALTGCNATGSNRMMFKTNEEGQSSDKMPFRIPAKVKGRPTMIEFIDHTKK